MTAASRFREFVAQRFGLRFDDNRIEFLAAVMERRAEVRGIGVESYIANLAGDELEATALGSDLTVGETYFFRNFEQFAALRDNVLPERLDAIGADGELRILSAGCSSGEEPFSLAMLCRSGEPPLPRLSIRAVDLNPAALQRAATGRYGSWSLRETPPDMLARWFKPRAREFDLDPDVRQAVQFERGNLADPACRVWAEGSYDVIFCRNVIMYFTADVQRAVVARLSASLAPGGYLFLGHAETLRGLSRDFHLVHTHGTFYYQRYDSAAEQSDRPPVDFVPHHAPAPSGAPLASDPPWIETIGRASRRIQSLARPAASLAPTPSPASGRSLVADSLESLARERFAEALALLDELPRHAEDPDVVILRAVLLMQAGNYAAAALACRSLIACDEHHAGANYVLGLCFEGTGAPASAFVHYDLAAHIDPLFAMPLLRRGLLSRRSGQSASARADLLRALELLGAEDASRLLLFGGGFTRAALQNLCLSELTGIEAAA